MTITRITINRLIKKYNLVKYTDTINPNAEYYTFPSSIPLEGYTMKIFNGELFMAGFISIDNNTTISQSYWITPDRPGEHIRKLHNQLLYCTKKFKIMKTRRKLVELKEDFV